MAPKTEPESWAKTAVEKARRNQKARRRGDRTLLTLAQVGTLAWMFILPVLGCGWIAHLALRDTSQRWLSVPLLGFGVLVGAALVRRKVLMLLQEDEEDVDD